MLIYGFHLISNRILPLESASSLDELTGRLSDGVYTTFTTLSGGARALGLSLHLKRLYDPAAARRLHPSVDERTLRKHIAELAKTNLPGESRIRLILTWDTGDVYAGVQPFTPLPEAVFTEGVHVLTADVARHDPRVKGTDFIFQSAEQRRLIRDDVFEILLTHNGEIFEGMTSNFYAVRHAAARAHPERSVVGTKDRPKQSYAQAERLLRRKNKSAVRNDTASLITAQRGILLGVTRHVALRLARGEGLEIEYRPPRLDEDFDEAFLTSSSRGVAPIVMIDGQPVGQGKPGAWTKRLSLAYQAYVREGGEEIVPK